MKPKFIYVVLLLLFSATVVGAFAIEDQFRKKYDFRYLIKKGPMILLAGDARKTARWIKSWAGPLRKRYGKRVRVFGLADLDGVPFFVSNNSVRNSLKESCPDTPIFCDWDGKVYKMLGFAKGYTVRVYDRKGKILGDMRGEYSVAKLERVARLLP